MPAACCLNRILASRRTLISGPWRKPSKAPARCPRSSHLRHGRRLGPLLDARSQPGPQVWMRVESLQNLLPPLVWLVLMCPSGSCSEKPCQCSRPGGNRVCPQHTLQHTLQHTVLGGGVKCWVFLLPPSMDSSARMQCLAVCPAFSTGPGTRQTGKTISGSGKG